MTQPNLILIMFFSTYVLTKKGDLAKIWLAAHWERKLTAKEVSLIDLKHAIVSIIKPTVPIALRTCGELMLGVVRIYAIKVMALLKEVNANVTTTLLIRPRQVQVLKGTKEGGKDTTLAVTMDVVVARVGGQQLADAEFSSIADILSSAPGKTLDGKPGKTLDGEKRDRSHFTSDLLDDPAAGMSWFATGGSQFQDNIRLSGPELEALRGDLAKFNNDQLRNSSSTTTGAKSSLSSAEQARGTSHTVVDPAGFDALNGEVNLDDFALHGLNAGFNPLDVVPEALPPMDPNVSGAAGDVPAAEGEAAPFGRTPMPRKLKLIPMDPEGETIMGPDALRKLQADRHDIVCGERRTGAVDENDARDRATLRTSNTAVVSCLPMTFVKNPELMAAFQSALKKSVQKAVEAMEKPRAEAGATGARASNGGFLHPAAADDDIPLPVAEFEYRPEEMPRMPAEDEEEEDEGRASGKRRRMDDGSKGKTLSASTAKTLEAVRALLMKASSISFNKLVAGRPRNEAALTFVDCLALVSQRYLELSQAQAFGDIQLKRTDKLMEKPSA